MLTMLFSLAAAAPIDEITEGESPYVDMTYLVAGSTKTYAEAMAVAVKVADGASLPLWPRGLVYDPQHKDYAGGLTGTKEACERDSYPCYSPRGRVDGHEIFISIEHTSNGIVQGFEDGYYIVVVGTGDRKTVAPALPKVKKVVPDAYLKEVKVYMGCLH